MANTLKGQQIKETYEGLLKTFNETPLDATPKLITDGVGTSSGIKLDSAGNIDVSNTLSFGSLKDTAEDITVSKFVDQADGIGNNDNDTSIPTSAAVKNYVDSNAGGGGTLNTQGDTGTGTVNLDTQSLQVTGENGLSVTATTNSLEIDGSALQTSISTNTTDISTNAGNIGTNTSSISTNASNIATKQSTSEKGQANGYAPLNSSSKVPAANLPDSLVGAVVYQGTWDASTNSPALPSAGTSQGYYYVVSIAGTYLGTAYDLGDWVISNGTDWQKVDNSANVNSVFGRTGNVIANANDYASFYASTSDLATTNTNVSGNASDITTNANNISGNTTNIATNTSKLTTIETGAQVNTITSVNTLTGAVSLGLLELDDVGIDGQNGQVLTTNGAGTFTFEDAPGGGGGAVDSVNGQTGTVLLDAADLEDVSNVAPGDGQVLRFNSTTGIYEPTTLSSTAPVDSVNGQIGAVLLGTDDISEGTSNLYFTDARVAANAAVAANTAKVGITNQQIADIQTNNAKIGITTQQRDDIIANNAKISFDSVSSNKLANIEAGAQVNVATNLTSAPTNSAVSIYSSTGSDTSISSATTSTAGVMSSTDKTKLDGIAQGAEVNTVDSVNGSVGPVSLGLLDLDDVGADGNSNDVLITDGNGNFSFAAQSGGGGVTSVNGLSGAVTLDSDNIPEGSNNLYYTDARVSANTDVVANTAKTGITTAQANEITANTAKVGITPTQASEIAANTLKTGITTQQASDITANNAKVTRRPITAGGNTLETSESLTLTAGSNVTITEAAGTVTIASIGGGSYTPNIVSGATTASKDNLYIFTASATLTLPASPSGGDSIKVSNLSGTTTCVLAGNGSNIMADASNMTLDNQYASFELIYGDATRGWVVVGGN